jgi:hypothetical protein
MRRTNLAKAVANNHPTIYHQADPTATYTPASTHKLPWEMLFRNQSINIEHGKSAKYKMIGSNPRRSGSEMASPKTVTARIA